jgi:hypothetical protein
MLQMLSEKRPRRHVRKSFDMVQAKAAEDIGRMTAAKDPTDHITSCRHDIRCSQLWLG